MADDHGEAPQAEEAPPAEAKEELDEQPDTEGETAAEPAEGNAPAPAEGEDPAAPAEGDAAAPADGDAAPAEGTEPRECFQPEARYAASPYLRLTRPLCHPPLDKCSH